MARRRRFHRVAPDRGWIVGQTGPTGLQFPASEPDDATRYFTLFDFADIDPDALTGRIEQDKSDWFIKRAILNICLSCQLDGLNENDTLRLVQWAMGTIGVENAAQLESANAGAGFPIIGPEAYNLWARQFQSGVMPVYHLPVIPYGVGNPSNNFGVGVVSMDEVPGSGGGDPAGWTLTGLPYGPALREYDFTVSNAGLRNNQECGIAFTMTRGPSGQVWRDGDALGLTMFYQVLVQKRRT